MTGAEHETMMAAYRNIHADLLAATLDRPTRRDLVDVGFGTEMGWVVYERRTVLAAANRLRGTRAPLTEMAVWRAEGSAAGHVDYAHKYALRVAALVVGP